MRRGGGRDHAPVALAETGVVLGEMLRRALADRLAAQAARRTEAPGPEGRWAGDDGGGGSADDPDLGEGGRVRGEALVQ
jgi:hypothetical protein